MEYIYFILEAQSPHSGTRQRSLALLPYIPHIWLSNLRLDPRRDVLRPLLAIPAQQRPMRANMVMPFHRLIPHLPPEPPLERRDEQVVAPMDRNHVVLALHHKDLREPLDELLGCVLEQFERHLRERGLLRAVVPLEHPRGQQGRRREVEFVGAPARAESARRGAHGRVEREDRGREVERRDVVRACRVAEHEDVGERGGGGRQGAGRGGGDGVGVGEDPGDGVAHVLDGLWVLRRREEAVVWDYGEDPVCRG